MSTLPKEPKVGDVVHVRAVVAGAVDHDGELYVKVERQEESHHWPYQYVDVRSIVHIEPAPLKVGDRVQLKNSTYTAKVLCIDGDSGWIKYDLDGRHGTVNIYDLTRISDGAES
jgi:hypothetical protein